MAEADASVRDGEGGNRPNALLTRIQLWTRISSYSQEPVAVSGAPATGRIADLSSIIARTRSPQTCLPSTTRNRAQDPNHANLSSGQHPRIGPRFLDRFERSQALSAKYGLDFTESDWVVHTNRPVQRVERSIRMRIRFRCHHCNTPYGNSRVCSQCSHQRCSRCVRQPPRRATPRARMADTARTSDALSVENLHAHSMAAAASTSQYTPIPIVPQAYASGGHESAPRTEAVAALQEPVQNGTGAVPLGTAHRRVARQSRVRVHHVCHECQKTFLPGQSACSGCGHERCVDCPRELPPRWQPSTRSGTRNLDHSTPALASGSAGGGDKVENDPIPEATTSTMQKATGAKEAASPSQPSRFIESIDAEDLDVAPPEPPLPPPPPPPPV